MANTTTQLKIMQALREAPGPCSMYTLQEVTGASKSALYRALRGLIAEGSIQKWLIDGCETGYGFAEYEQATCPPRAELRTDVDRIYRWEPGTRSFSVSYEDLQTVVLGPHDFAIGAVRVLEFPTLFGSGAV